MNVQLTEHNVRGNEKGKKLFVLVTVDQEDTEDTTIELWRADSEDELYELVKEAYVGETEEEDGDTSNLTGRIIFDFDSDWGFSILFTEVGVFLS